MGLLTTFFQINETRDQEMLDALDAPSIQEPNDLTSFTVALDRVDRHIETVNLATRTASWRSREIADAFGSASISDSAFTDLAPSGKPWDIHFPLLSVGIVDATKVPPKVIKQLKKYEANKAWARVRIPELEKEKSKLKKQLKGLLTTKREEELKTKAPVAGEFGRKHKNIDEKDIPQKVLLAGRTGRGFDNPYWMNKSHDKFAGDPAFYDFGNQTVTYYQLQNLLKESGLEGFTLCYGCTIGTSTRQFFVFGAKGAFAWRKTGTGQGAQNDVYLNGRPIHTSSLTSTISSAQIILKNVGLIK